MAFFLSIYGTHGVKLFSIVKFGIINNDINAPFCIESLLMIPYKNKLILVINCILLNSTFIVVSSQVQSPGDTEQVISVDKKREEFLDDQVLQNPYLDQGFQLLYDRNLLTVDMPNSFKSPLYNYFDEHVSHDIDDASDEEANFGDVHVQAVDLVVQTIKDPYLQDFELYIKDPASVPDTSIIEYVMNPSNRVIVPMVLKKIVNTYRIKLETIRYDGYRVMFDRDTFLHQAIMKNNMELFSWLLTAGADMHVKNSKSETPLMLAVRADNIVMVKDLLNKKFDITFEDLDSDQNLFHEIQSSEMVQVFYDNENLKNTDGILLGKRKRIKKEIKPFSKILRASIEYNPLYSAVVKDNLEVVQALLPLIGLIPKGDVHLRRNMWDHAKKNIVMARALLDHGWEINLKNKKRETLFFQACKDDDVEMMKTIFSHDIKYNDQDRALMTGFYESPLSHVIIHGKKLAFNELVDNHRQYQSDVVDGLFVAIEERQSDAMMKILEVDPNLVNSKDEDNKTLLYYALELNYIKGVEILLNIPCIDLNLSCENKSKYNALIKAVLDNKIEIVKKIVTAGVDVNCVDEQNKSAFDYAMMNNYIEIIHELLRAKNIDISGLLHDAVKINGTEIVDAVVRITNGFEINKQYELGLTPLHIAVMNNNSFIVKLLLDGGACLDIENNDGLTPQQLAKDLYMKNMIINEKRRRDMLNK